jgi:hypothetical protein
MTNLFEQLALNSGLYPEKVRKEMGETSVHWSSESWKKREAFLRHQMVCTLLCNTEELVTDEVLNIKRNIRAAASDRGSEGPQTSGASSVGTENSSHSSHHGSTLDPGVATIYRCELLEGKSNLTVLQNKITREKMQCKAPFKKMYDIYDLAENKLVEVKVTIKPYAELEKFKTGPDPDQFISFIHLNPRNPSQVKTWNMTNRLPGVHKAISFLQTRLETWKNLGMMDYEVDPDVNLTQDTLCDPAMNEWVDIWKSSFWDKRMDKTPDDYVSDAANEDNLKPLVEPTLKNALEDVSKRKDPFMEYNGLLLPPYWKTIVETHKAKDSEMMEEMLELLGSLTALRAEDHDIIDAVNEVTEIYNDCVIEGHHSHFQWLSQRDLEKSRNFKWVIGIGVKNSVEYDNHPDLAQPEYGEPPKRRYHPWMSGLLTDLTLDHGKPVEFYGDLMSPEYVWPNAHPMVTTSDAILSIFLHAFGKSWSSMFCSEIRNTFSRLGGAYSSTFPNKRFAEVVAFPLYSTGVVGEERKRYLSGLIIRGESHAKQPTDRIPLLIVELCDEFSESAKYLRFIKKAKWARTSKGQLVCVRQNSIMKSDPTYLSYVHNSLYLSANMMGDLLLKSLPTPNSDLQIHGVAFMARHKEWVLERITEGVIMALMGGSQEEGAMAIIRKIFMMKVAWMRKRPVFGWDEVGLADALNECLFDHPFALYLAYHLRETLSDELILPDRI